MRKHKCFVITGLILLMTISIGANTQAYSYPFTGEFMFVHNGNDPTDANSSNAQDALDELELEMEQWFSVEKQIVRDIELSFYDKVDAPNFSSIHMTVTYGSGNKHGTWTTDVPIEFYTVKGGNEFALYWIDGGESSGFWTTEELSVGQNNNVPTISHLSAFNPLDQPTPIPEPTTLLLLGTGLAGLAGYKRRNYK